MRNLVAEHVVLHVRIKGVALATLRMRLALRLLWLASKIAGTGLVVTNEEGVSAEFGDWGGGDVQDGGTWSRKGKKL